MNPPQSGGQPGQAAPAQSPVTQPNLPEAHPLAAPLPAADVALPVAALPAEPALNASLLEQITVRARHVVAQTGQDPRRQAIELEQLKREYVQKQYGITIQQERS